MESKQQEDVKSKTPLKYYLEVAQTVALRFVFVSYDSECDGKHNLMSRYGARAPPVPGPDRYAAAWEVPDELVTPRVLRRIYYFKDLGQDLRLSCFRCK